MKRGFFLSIFAFLACVGIFAQQFTVLVAPFDVRAGFSLTDADTITELFLTELAKHKTIKVVDQSQAVFKEIARRIKFEISDWSNPNKVADLYQALNANAFVRGQMMMLGDQRIITARILDVKTTEVLATSRMDIKNVNDVLDKLPAFTTEIVTILEPPSNPFVGKWRSTIISNKETLTCILNFEKDGKITVERYDANKITLERRKHTNDIDRGKGGGIYSCRESGGKIVADISLTISGVSHEFVAVNAQGNFSASSPNQFTTSPMQCECFNGKITDSYKTFNRM